MARCKSFKPYIGQITTARQFMRHRNICFGLPLREIKCATIPFGYEQDPDKEGWLRPVQKQLEALFYARRFQQRSSYEGIAAWITKETGRSITGNTVRIIFRYRPPLSVYLLDLNDRLAIATAETEDKAIEYSNNQAKWGRNPYPKATEKYYQYREEAVRRKEAAKGIKRTQERKE